MRSQGIPCLGLFALFLGCSGNFDGMTELRTPGTGEAFGGVQCSAVRPSTEPDLMAWDAQDRSSLKAISEAGIVAVRYEAKGCDVRLEILSNCAADGNYGFNASPATDTTIARNAQELFTSLPLGAARLAGKVQKGRALRTDYTQVGVRLLPPGTMITPKQLRGEGCERATHVVNKIWVGGFAMAAMDEQAVEASASVFGVGAGGGVTGKAERITSEGVALKCEEAQNTSKESAACGTPLRLALQALDAVAVAVSCPEGTELQGDKCVRKKVVTQVQSPSGTTWNGTACGGNVNTNCAAGTHWIAGTGCVGVSCGGNGRFLVQDPGSSCDHSDGSGRVKDTSTGLTWMRHSYKTSGFTQAKAAAYCQGKSMRLPTKDDAVAIAIAGEHSANCAFPCFWYTWTSSSAGSGGAWYVDAIGGPNENAVNNGNSSGSG